MPSPLRAGALALLVLAACRPDTVDLAYRFAEGQRQYRLTADIESRWDIGDSGGGACHVELDVVENVREENGGTAVLEVTMEPVEVEEDGLACPRGGGFTLEIDRSGRVSAVLEVDGVDAAEIAEEESAFIGTYRPTLPGEPVGLGDVWESQPQRAVGSLAQLATQGELDALYRDDDGPVAELSYRGAGPLQWVTELPQGTAGLGGSAEIRSTAKFDIDRGVLVSASSVLRGDFDVRVQPSSGGSTPLTGTLSLELELEVEASD